MRKVAFGIIAAAVGASGAAHAEDEPVYHNTPQSAFLRDRNISVLERARPEYASAGVNLGGFTALPRVTARVGYDDNIYATSTQVVGDVVTELKPELRVVSNWSRNELEAFAHASANSYARHRRENTIDWAAGAKGRWDVVGLSYLFADGGYGEFTIPRSSGSSPANAAERQQFYQANASVGAVEELNRLRFTERLDAQTYRYLDVAAAGGAALPGQGACPSRPTVICSYDQNHKTYTASGKAEVAISPAVALFGVVAANERTYDYSPAQVLIDRNSHGYEVTGGASFDVAHLARGELQLGWLDQTYRNHQPVGGPAAFPGVRGLAVHGKVEWLPDERTTITFKADRTVQDWSVPSSSGAISTEGGVRVDHELLRNVIVSANGGYSEIKYGGIDRTDDLWKAGANVNYLLNRGLGIGLNYGYLSQESRGAPSARGNAFSDNRLMASLTLQY